MWSGLCVAVCCGSPSRWLGRPAPPPCLGPAVPSPEGGAGPQGVGPGVRGARPAAPPQPRPGRAELKTEPKTPTLRPSMRCLRSSGFSFWSPPFTGPVCVFRVSPLRFCSYPPFFLFFLFFSFFVVFFLRARGQKPELWPGGAALRGTVVYFSVGTPETNEHYLQSRVMYGLDHTVERCASIDPTPTICPNGGMVSRCGSPPLDASLGR